MNLFHEVELADCDAKGKLFLHSMPGRFEPISEFIEAMGAGEIYCILCLVSDAEIEEKSPRYLEALGHEVFERRVMRMPIEDHSIPGDPEEFKRVMDILTAALDAGKNVLIHCAAGVGRTGTAAVCLLTDLGFDPEEATRRIIEAGSEPEGEGQRAFIQNYSKREDRE